MLSPPSSSRSPLHALTRSLEPVGVLVEFLKLQPGRLHLCLEEVTQSAWLTEILTPHVDELVVTMPERSRWSKHDAIDAFGLAEQLRRGAIDTRVFKHQGPYGTLRQLVKVHRAVVDDRRRVQNRLKALFRSRGVPTPGKGVYALSSRERWLELLPASSRSSAEILYEQYDALSRVRNQAKKELVRESHRFPITRTLETCPGLGEFPMAWRGSCRWWSRRTVFAAAGSSGHAANPADREPPGRRSWSRSEERSMAGSCDRRATKSRGVGTRRSSRWIRRVPMGPTVAWVW